MKVPLSWLRECVEFELSAEALAEKLTFSGTEVESIERVGSALPGVVVAEILAVEPHPRAERLRLCRVADGRGTLQVVCGAPNAAAGRRAALARPGTVLPNGQRIERSEIRGQLSEGMLCAEDELGLSEDHSGILLLDTAAPIGMPLAEALGLPETVLELEVTWNRPDCLCVLGMAREVAALTGGRLRRPPAQVAEGPPPVETLAAVAVEDPAGCPRYTARVLTGARLGPSPFWLRQRLRLCGVRPISNLVDVTNYVMLECGQPLHAFDYERLEGRRIVVRRARPGERLATLDGLERPITPQMLVIADAARPVALAGIMGGAGSEIGEGTTRVLLESACFAAPLIRATAVAVGLTTESSYRYERGVDPEGAEWASRRAARLMAELSGAAVAQGVLDVYPGRRPPREIRCRYARARRLLGIELSEAEITQRLEALELPIVARDAESCTVRAPSFRPDLEIEADLIEEVARLHGLDGVPAGKPAGGLGAQADDSAYRAREALRSNLAALGLNEILSYSFVSEAALNLFSPDAAARRVVLPNPVSADYAALRDSLIPQLVEALGRNQARQTTAAAFFELGRVFLKEADGRIREEERVALGLLGKAGRLPLDGRRPVGAEEMFLWAKGLVEALCAAQGLGAVELRAEDVSYAEAGWSAAVWADGRRCGVLALAREALRREWRIPEPLALAELETEALIGRYGAARAAQPTPAYPGIVRDIALIVDEGVRHEEIVAWIRKVAPPELTSVELFDIFRGRGIGAGKKSLAYSLVYRSSERTLTDEEANRFHEQVGEALKRELHAQIRDG